ncbi:hypothetical protein PT273_07515 [Orbaceae bacterium ESL0727]|nr:hypothetical protein [Orbaceae bacterium ESL0727]
MNNTKKTSAEVASLASKVLHNPNASELEKSLAASVLSQTKSDSQTGKAMETKASQVLHDPNASKEIKTLAASVLAQANKER